jgi:hypothetical protein
VVVIGLLAEIVERAVVGTGVGAPGAVQPVNANTASTATVSFAEAIMRRA